MLLDIRILIFWHDAQKTSCFRFFLTPYSEIAEERVQVIEVDDLEVQSIVLREFVRKAPGANRGYSISPDAPSEAYAAIIPEHPVFRVIA